MYTFRGFPRKHIGVHSTFAPIINLRQARRGFPGDRSHIKERGVVPYRDFMSRLGVDTTSWRARLGKWIDRLASGPEVAKAAKLNYKPSVKPDYHVTDAPPSWAEIAGGLAPGYRSAPQPKSPADPYMNSWWRRNQVRKSKVYRSIDPNGGFHVLPYRHHRAPISHPNGGIWNVGNWLPRGNDLAVYNGSFVRSYSS